MSQVRRGVVGGVGRKLYWSAGVDAGDDGASERRISFLNASPKISFTPFRVEGE